MKAFSNTLIIIPSPECSASINLGVCPLERWASTVGWLIFQWASGCFPCDALDDAMVMIS
jgi:hypothetical protein